MLIALVVLFLVRCVAQDVLSTIKSVRKALDSQTRPVKPSEPTLQSIAVFEEPPVLQNQHTPRLSERLKAMSEESIVACIANDKCPECLGELDTGFECNDCGFDAIGLAQYFGEARLSKARTGVLA